jgi:EmrB/QacA subfamily drug resistance transporter
MSSIASSGPVVTDVVPGALHPRRWHVLVVVLLADVMDLLDSTVMNVAAPSVREGLGGGETTMQWLSASYTLAFGVLLVIGGRLGDRWGRRRLFTLGAAGFTIASAACALAPTPGILIAARAVQGASGALMIPQGLGVLTAVFTPSDRSRAFGLFGPAMGLSAIGGPLLAGALIGLAPQTAGWRLIFLINIPLGLVATVGAAIWMPFDRGDRSLRIDPVGAALIALGSALLVHPLIEGGQAGWPWWTIVELVGAAAAFAALARRQRTAASPILVPSLLRNRVFLAGLGTATAFFAGVGGLTLVFSLFLQLDRHDSALRTALTLVPLALGLAVSSVLSARLAGHLGRGVLHLGLAVEGAGALTLGAVALLGAPAPAFGTAALVIGLGLGFVFGPLIQSVLAGAAEHEVGSASGVLNAAEQIATALGVAALGTVFFALDARPAALATCALTVAALAVLAGLLVRRLPRALASTAH